MKKNYLVLMVLILSILSCKNTTDKEVDNQKQEAVELKAKPESSFTDIDGKPIELSDFKGKRILLNYWATWCRPCIEEMPALLKAQEVLSQENYVILLASDQSLEKIKSFKEKKKFDFHFLRFNGSLSDVEVTALPATFIYNESGKLINRIDGATEWDSPKIMDELKAVN